MIDKLIKDYREKEVFRPKDFQSTTIKTRLGDILIARRRYKMVIKGKVKWINLLDEILQINDFGLYSQGIVEMVAREITKKSYRETAKTISEDTDSTISHTAVRNIVINGDGADWTGNIIEGAKKIFSFIYNYKVELETDNRLAE